MSFIFWFLVFNIVYDFIIFCFSWSNLLLAAVIDIMRMVVLHPDGAATLLKHVNDENGKWDVVNSVIE